MTDKEIKFQQYTQGYDDDIEMSFLIKSVFTLRDLERSK